MSYPFYNKGAVKQREHFDFKQSYAENQCVSDMRRNYYLPVLDEAPEFEIEYSEKKDAWLYTVTVYGRRAPEGVDVNEYQGWLNGRLLKDK